MLAQSAQNIVYSEPPLADEILSSNLSNDVKVEMLRSALSLMGQKRKTSHQYLFIKWDSWHLAYYELIRQAFPSVPAIFLYREPIEVLQSHQRVRGMHMVPGLLKKDVFQLKDIPAYDLDLYAANVLAKLYGWMIDHAENKLAKLVNYSELPGGLFDIVKGMKLEYQPAELKAMEDRSKRHSKQGFENSVSYSIEKSMKKLKKLSQPLNEIYKRLEISKV